MTAQQTQPAGPDDLQGYLDLLQSKLANLPPDYLEWWLMVFNELLTDIEAHQILVQVFPDMPGPDVETWQPSTPPPGWSQAEYSIFRAGLQAGWRGARPNLTTKGRGQ